MPSTSLPFSAAVAALLLVSPVLVRAQAAPDSDSSSVAVPSSSTGASQNASCSILSLQSSSNLTFKQRNCYAARRLFSPMNAAGIVAFAVLDQARNSPIEPHNRWSMLPHRLESYYARHAARESAELLVGYWHHEDPRPHRSLETGFWKRTNAAALSVIASPDQDGHLRPALAPMAGSLSSAFVGSALSRRNQTLPDTMIRAGAVYGFYFVRAVFAEFKPDIDSMVRRVLNR